MKNEIDAFLGDLGENMQDLFSNETQDLPEFNEPVPEKTKDEPSQKPEPFHKNPKFKKLVEQNKELSDRIAKLSEAERFNKGNEENGDDEISNVLSRIIGNDTPEKLSAIKDFGKAISGIKDKARDEALDYFNRQEQESRSAEKQADDSLSEAFESIEETYGVDITSNTPIARKTRNEFISFIQRIAPKNENGEIAEYPDLEESFDVFRGMNKPVPSQNSRAKDIASRSMSRSTDTSETKPSRRITWDTVERDLDKLTG